MADPQKYVKFADFKDVAAAMASYITTRDEFHSWIWDNNVTWYDNDAPETRERSDWEMVVMFLNDMGILRYDNPLQDAPKLPE